MSDEEPMPDPPTMAATNVMISYSHKDTPFMLRIKDLLIAQGYSVWVDHEIKGGANFFENIGSAIIGCQIFLFLLTKDSVSSKFCQDEVSLARISDKQILPITYCNVREVMEEMDSGMRLVLSCVQWVCLKDGEGEEKNDQVIVDNLALLQNKNGCEMERMTSFSATYSIDDVVNKAKTFKRSESVLYKRGFWARNFPDQDEVELKDILKAIKKDYSYDYKNIFVKDSWVLGTLGLWCFDFPDNTHTSVTKEQYNTFIFPAGNPNTLPEDADMFWARCKDGFSIRLSMHEVFDENSSVRFDSIKNLGKIKSARVLTALYKLLRNPDPNIRAIACIALANSGDTSSLGISKIIYLLDDKDRLVRESACLSLARYKQPEGKAWVNPVPKILSVWRDDPISDVRNAALKALETIGSEEAMEGMLVLKVLQAEIKQLA